MLRSESLSARLIRAQVSIRKKCLDRVANLLVNSLMLSGRSGSSTSLNCFTFFRLPPLCPLFAAPSRRCGFVFSNLRSLYMNEGGGPFGVSNSRSLPAHPFRPSNFGYSLSFQGLAHSCPALCALLLAPIFCFQYLADSFGKYRGVGGCARPRQPHQRSLRPNCTCREVLEVLVMAPAVGETPEGVKTTALGRLKLARFSRLKISARN